MLNNLPGWLHFIFGFLGMLTFAFGGAGLLMWITETIRKIVDHTTYEHKQKHRFDKPPIAKCYCRDCHEWQPDENMCWHSGIHMAAYEFCSSAFPRNEESDICKKCRKEKLMPTRYRCPECRSLLIRDGEWMTGYPIQEVLYCEKCKENYYLLVDHVLCSESDYEQRVKKYYQPEGVAT